MIRPLAVFLHVLDAARTACTLSRTVLVLSRQLDNAHLLAASEEARADRAELRVAELEAQTRDWAELSGELAREQPADALPDLTDAAPPPVTPDPLRETDQRDRADSLMRTLHATEAIVLDLRARLATAEREAKEARAQLQQTERAAGAHVATIEALREQIAAAHRAAHAPPPIDPCQCGHEAKDHGRTGCLVDMVSGLCPCERFQVYGHHPRPVEQIPGVVAADEPPTCAACNKPALAGSERTGEAEAVLLCGRCRATAEAEEAARPPRLPSREALYAAVMRRSDEINAAADDPPPTRPSERTRTT